MSTEKQSSGAISFFWNLFYLAFTAIVAGVFAYNFNVYKSESGQLAIERVTGNSRAEMAELRSDNEDLRGKVEHLKDQIEQTEREFDEKVAGEKDRFIRNRQHDYTYQEKTIERYEKQVEGLLTDVTELRAEVKQLRNRLGNQ